jgi:hypothetical protein
MPTSNSVSPVITPRCPAGSGDATYAGARASTRGRDTGASSQTPRATAVSSGIPQCESTTPILRAAGRFHVEALATTSPRSELNVADAVTRPVNGAPCSVIAKTGRSIGPESITPFSMCAPTGTPGGANRKKSAFTAAIGLSARSSPASNALVVLRPTATGPPFTACNDTHAVRSTSSTAARHGSALCTSRCNVTPGASASLETVSAMVRASRGTLDVRDERHGNTLHALSTGSDAIAKAMRQRVPRSTTARDCTATSPPERSP